MGTVPPPVEWLKPWLPVEDGAGLDEGRALEGDDGAAHPQRIAGRGAARKRKRVERDVHLPVRFEQLRIGEVAAELEPSLLDAARCESRDDVRTRFRLAEVARTQHEPCGRNRAQDRGPGVDHALVELGQPVERSEYRSIATRVRRRRRRRRRRIAEAARGEPEQALAVALAGSLGRQPGVADPAVDRSDAGRVEPVEPAQLQGSDATREYGHAVRGRMAGEVDHYVEAEATQPAQQRIVVEAGCIDGLVREIQQGLAGLVLHRLQRHHHVLMPRAVELGEQPVQERRNRT